MNKSACFFLGIGGLSRSGKTFLAQNLQAGFLAMGMNCLVLNQDDFVLPTSSIPLVKNHIDWEIPESIDWDRLREKIMAEKDGLDVLVVEGLMAFNKPWLENLYDYSIYIQLSYSAFLNRKRADLRWGQEPEWYIKYIWDAHQQHGLPAPGMEVDLVLNGDKYFDLPEVKKLLHRAYRAKTGLDPVL